MFDEHEESPRDGDLAWDDLCVDPHKRFLDEGRMQGKVAGLEAGFKDGSKIGALKGVEFGIDLGFMHGVLQVVLDTLATNSEAFGDKLHRERIQKTANALTELLDNFPCPNQIFGEQNKDWLQEIEAYKTRSSAEEDPSDTEQEGTSDSLDLFGQMQSIQSKFKLLTIQLKWTNLSLKTVMEEAKDTCKPSTQDEFAAAATMQSLQNTEW